MSIRTLLVDFGKGGAGSAIAVLALLGMTACASVRDKEAPASTAAAAGPAPAAPLCPTIDGPPSPPAGWTYLPEIAAHCVADIFHLDARTHEGQPSPQIVVATRRNVGILEHAVDVALDEATRLEWKGNVTQIPSTLPENVAADHDYLSIAVKFDNGQDLTYMWSASLEPGTGFRCPLPGWDTRETHVVRRSGRKDLGQWLHEGRNIRADYAKYAVAGYLPGSPMSG
ncbi:MAG: DUF3047 domain-containing protein [Gemmatimonadales bacterium]